MRRAAPRPGQPRGRGVIAGVLLLLLLGPLLAAPAAAHTPGFQVGQVFIGDLPEGAEETFGLAPPTGPMPAGLLLVVSAIVYNGTAAPQVSLQLANATLLRWGVAPGQVTRHLAALTPEPGNYVLGFRNPGPGPVKVGFFYDVACDCPAKPLPVAVPHGALVWPLDVTPGAWAVNVTEPPVHRLDIDVSRFTGAGASDWPNGFDTVVQSLAGPSKAQHRLPWPAPEGGLFYLVVRSAKTDLAALDLASPEAQNATTLVTTSLLVRTGDIAVKGAPGPGPLAGLGVAALAALGAARLRRGPRNG